MTDTAPDTVLKRKAEAGRSLSGGAPVPDRALGQALAKAAHDMIKLPLCVTGMREGRMSVGEIIESLPERALLALLEGPKDGLGLMVLAPELVASLIEMQMTGRIGATAILPRRPTRTDAAMTAPFVDRVLGEFETILSAEPATVWAGGFRYASHIDEPRPLGLLLEDGAYRVFTATLGCGEEGGRQAALILALPAEGRGKAPARLDGPGNAPGGSTGPDASADWSARMERAVLGASLRLDAVLDRVSMPLAVVLALKPGAQVPLAPGALTRLSLESGGRVVARGKLGQSQGHLAVRVVMPSEAAERDAEASAGGTEEAEARRLPLPTEALARPRQDDREADPKSAAETRKAGAG